MLLQPEVSRGYDRFLPVSSPTTTVAQGATRFYNKQQPAASDKADQSSEMDSWQSYIGDNATTSKTSRFNPKKPASVFKKSQRSSVYSIDVPRDTRYLKVDHGRVSPLRPDDYPSVSPSPVSSDVSSMDEIKPPVPLKARAFGFRKQSTPQRAVTMPVETPTYVAEMGRNKDSARTSQGDSTPATQDKSPELPSLGTFDVGLRDQMENHMPGSRFSWTTCNTEATQLPITPEQSPDLANLPGRHERDMPPSRFSWTTYNTARSPPMTSGTDTSARTPETMYQRPISPPPSPPSPVLTRRRPIARPDAHLNVVKRKPTPSEAASTIGTGPATPQSKDLPLAPPELASVDRITALRAQLDELQYRRFNLDKVICNLQSVQLHNPVVQDLARRRADRERLAGFETELAETRNKEHELGMSLHRALKKRDQEEPSGLWVRRVTS